MGYGAYSDTAQSSAPDSAVEVDAAASNTSIEEVPVRRGTDCTPAVTFEYASEGEASTTSNVYPGRGRVSSTPGRRRWTSSPGRVG